MFVAGRCRLTAMLGLSLWSMWIVTPDKLFASDRPNVLFLAVDDLRPALGCYGDGTARTPHIDHLAASGLLFNRAYCQQAVCNPSRQSVLSGRRPDSIRVWTMVDHFRKTAPDVVSLPGHFKQHGYFTQSFGKIFHGAKGMSHPPSWSVPEQFAYVDRSANYLLPENLGRGEKQQSFEAATVDDDAYNDGVLAAHAIAALGELKDRPFFLAVGFRKPHLPFSAPQKYWDLYDRAKISLPDPATAPTGAPQIAGIDWKELRGYSDVPDAGPLADEKIRELRHGYYAAVSYVDAQIGRVLAELDRLGLRERTIVVLWSDHGYHLGEQNLWCKDTNYECATRVPLILSVPGDVKRGTTTDALVELIDIYPTLVELCGLPSPSQLDGVSLTPLLADPTVQVKEFAQSQFPRPWKSGEPPQNMGYALRSNRWRYVEWIDFTTRELLGRELYDLSADLQERVNLAEAPEYAATIQEMSRCLNARLDANGK